jgi:hypothetical protein
MQPQTKITIGEIALLLIIASEVVIFSATPILDVVCFPVSGWQVKAASRCPPSPAAAQQQGIHW